MLSSSKLSECVVSKCRNSQEFADQALKSISSYLLHRYFDYTVHNINYTQFCLLAIKILQKFKLISDNLLISAFRFLAVLNLINGNEIIKMIS